MEQNDILKLEKKLKKELDVDRYRHTMGVMYTAAALAMCYGEDVNRAMTAGLLHDCAKCIPNDKKLHMCEKYRIEVSSIEKSAPSLLHSKLGACLARAEYGITDPEILSAIRWHTTGRPAMTQHKKIIFMADYIEPGRWKAVNLDRIRTLSFRDLDMAVYLTMRDTLAYLEKGSGTVDETTRKAYAYYEKIASDDE